MTEGKKELTAEEKRLLEFAHDCAQIASAETIQDMMFLVPIRWEEPKGGEKDVRDPATA